MPTSGTLSVVGTGDNAVFSHEHTTSASGDYKVLLETKNTFVDKDISITITTPAAGAATLNLTDLATSLSMGTASDGVYSPTANISGTITPATAGWIAASASNVSDNSVVVGKVNQSLLKNGTTSISSGTTIVPLETTTQTINITEGYESARTVVVGAMSSGQKATIVSGSGTISSVSYEYSSSNDNFSITGSAAIAAPSVTTSGYISSSEGTKTGNTATVNTTVGKVVVGSEIDGSYTKPTPVITRTAKAAAATWVDAASGSEVTAATAGLPYVQVDAAAITATLKTKGKVTTDGYGTTTYYGVASSLSTDAGSNAATTKYIPINIATITSTNTTATLGDPTYQSSGDNSGKFTITASGTVAAPTVTTAGYIDATNSVGTINSTGAISGTKVLNKITVGVTPSTTTSKVTPVITRTAKSSGSWIDAASGDAVTSTTSSKPYVQVDAAAVAGSLTVTGKVSAAGYGTTTSGQYATDSATTITTGTNAATTKYIPITEAATFSASIGTVTASDFTVGDKSNGVFPVTSNLSIPATLTAGTDGWFHSGTATGSKSSVSIGSLAEATFSVSGDSVTVATDGYVTSGTTVTSITGASFANTGTSGVSYSDISSSAPILISGDYLYINAGYVGNSKISLARLVPDDLSSSTLSFAPAQYILSGYAAFDSAGVEITGTMSTYSGAYTVT